MDWRQSSPLRHEQDAFTLIEMLVVVAVIALLAALIVPVARTADRVKIQTKTRAEMEQIATAIENYKSKRGAYPPDNPANPAINQLYYELSGTTLDPNGNYRTLDGFASLPSHLLGIPFGTNQGQPNLTGLANCSAETASDEAVSASDFLKPGLKANQLGLLDFGRVQIVVLISSIPWPANLANAPLTNTLFNPWRYDSSHPTNNPTAYDLWIDIPMGSKLVRFCNWNRNPINVK